MVGNHSNIGFVQKIIFSIVVLVLSNSILASSEIILSMQDMNHKSIKNAMCQAPFILQVELRNLDGYTDIHLMQHMTGIENFKSSRSMTSHNVSIDNGRKTVKTVYNFVLRSDKKGTFTLGPLVLNDKSGQSIRSNRLIVPVGDEVVLSEKNQKDTYFITMDIDKKQAYVGEKLTLRVKFYDRLFVDDLHLQFPDFKNVFIVQNKNNVHKNMVVFEGEEYSVTEWTFDIYGTEPEPLIIQGVHAAFFAPEVENKFKFGGSFDFFRSLNKQQQQIIASPIKAEIIPLPDSKNFSHVVAVGQFSKYTITMNQVSVPAGEGIVLTTELFGTGNFEMMQTPQLVLPEGFKYYDSNMVTIDEKRSYKHCEFIVLAGSPGTYHIEPQIFVYFDPIDGKYKTLQSNAIDLIVTPSTQLSQSVNVSDAILNDEVDDAQVEPKELQDFFVMQQGSVHARTHYMIAAYHFKIALWLLFFMWFLLACYQTIFKKYIVQHRVWNKFIIFSRALRTYNTALQQQETYKLYAIFIQIFRQLLGITFGELHDAVIVQYLRDKNFSDEQVQSWKKFYEQILQASFASQAHIQQPVLFQKSLFEQALQWIQLLKEKA